MSRRRTVGVCLVDTCSDVTIARLDVLTNVRMVEPTIVGHMGGETRLNRAGDFAFGGVGGPPCICFIAVLGVEHHDLPAGIVALIGLVEIRRMDLSLDYVLRNLDYVLCIRCEGNQTLDLGTGART